MGTAASSPVDGYTLRMRSSIGRQQRIGLPAFLAAVTVVAVWLGGAITVGRILDEIRSFRQAEAAAKAQPLAPVVSATPSPAG